MVKLCSPEIATPMFGSDERKYVSVMAPCFISIYEKADGKTCVSAMRMGLMGKLMGGEIGKVMADIVLELTRNDFQKFWIVTEARPGEIQIKTGKLQQDRADGIPADEDGK